MTPHAGCGACDAPDVFGPTGPVATCAPRPRLVIPALRRLAISRGLPASADTPLVHEVDPVALAGPTAAPPAGPVHPSTPRRPRAGVARSKGADPLARGV